MGIKSNRTIASYFNRFGTTGLDAVSPVPVPVYTEATGGIISDYTDGPAVYRSHIFTSSGAFNVTAPGTYGDTVDFLTIAGGGGGGQGNGGGGGAGNACLGYHQVNKRHHKLQYGVHGPEELYQ